MQKNILEELKSRKEKRRVIGSAERVKAEEEVGDVDVF